jgi:hypothetical protein
MNPNALTSSLQSSLLSPHSRLGFPCDSNRGFHPRLFAAAVFTAKTVQKIRGLPQSRIAPATRSMTSARVQGMLAKFAEFELTKTL